MLKGCQREMIVLNTKDSALFESAWLVLRQEKPEVGADDMLAEANRIIGFSGERRIRWGKIGAKVACFLLGMLLGAGFFAILWFLHR